MGKVKTALWAFSSFYEDFYTLLLTVFGRVACRNLTECSCAKSILKIEIRMSGHESVDFMVVWRSRRASACDRNGGASVGSTCSINR